MFNFIKVPAYIECCYLLVRYTEADLSQSVLTHAPFWAFLWPGGFGIASFIQHNSSIFLNSTVVDFGCGCGVATVAARLAGARIVFAIDIDEFALVATTLNASLNGCDMNGIFCSHSNLLSISEGTVDGNDRSDGRSDGHICGGSGDEVCGTSSLMRKASNNNQSSYVNVCPGASHDSGVSATDSDANEASIKHGNAKSRHDAFAGLLNAISICEANNNNSNNNHVSNRILLIGDMLYDNEIGHAVMTFARACQDDGWMVFVGDPGRHVIKNNARLLANTEIQATYELTEILKQENHGLSAVTVSKLIK